jgi:hypothetical protein
MRSFAACAALLLAASALHAQSADQVRFFESKVRPLLVKHCQDCHGKKKQSGGLRLDTVAGFRAGGDTGALIDEKKPLDSLLLRAVRHEGPEMPPKQKLPASDVDVLTRWVKVGAPWPADATKTRRRGVITDEDRAFWSYQPVRDHAVPVVKNGEWARTSVDRFVLARLEAKSLSPSAEADRQTLVRRLTFDLTGLPPTPEDVDAFVADRAPDSYERLVERLLASPAYGERWGRHWLDVVRYADTAGDNSDYPIPQAYRYRNWVIDALNADKPYDRFLREQVAGDLMPADTQEETFQRIVATGYLAGTRRYGSYEDKRYQWWLTYEDSIENVGRAVLGLGLGCARCHDHKFDPVTAEDYYALYGIFRSTRYPWPGIELDKVQRDLVPLESPARVAAHEKQRKAKLATLGATIGRLDADRARAEKLLKVAKKDEATEAKMKLANVQKELAAARRQRDAVAKEPPPWPEAYAVAEGTRWVGDVKVQLSGDPTKPGKHVPRRFLQILGGQTLPSDEKGSGRLHLAKWLTDAKNPLTARVMANRVWLYHFGRGLVVTPNDFGRQGRAPSHPELLDHLATRFVESGWSVKAMHRLILLSSTYRQASEDNESKRLADPENELLWRVTPRRLDAESIRDSLLSLSGELDRSPGGAHPFPPMSKWNFTQHNPFKAVYETDRRSVCLMTQRIQRHPYLALFDGADTNASTAKRTTSTTTLQALYLMNDPFVLRLARGFASRLQREAKGDAGRITLSFRLAFGRLPSSEEREAASEALAKMRAKLRESGEQADRVEARAWEAYARAVFMSNELVYVN